jgi:CRISPR/Cas system-associated exonuclease Cas4 (RecB family)
MIRIALQSIAIWWYNNMGQSLYRWSSAESPLIFSLRTQSYHHSTLVRGYELSKVESDTMLPVTALCEFLFCKRCFYTVYKTGLPKPNTKNAIVGRVLHEIHMQLLSREYELVSKFSFGEGLEETAYRYIIEAKDILYHMHRDFEEAFKRLGLKWEDELQRIQEHIEITSLEWANWIRELAIIHRVDGVELARICIPYRRFEEYYKAPDLALCGKVDVIENGIPVEVKAGKAPLIGIYSLHALQLIWYALLIEYIERKDVNYAEVYYAKKFERRKLVLTQELRRWALSVRDFALELLKRSPEEVNERCFHM